MADLTLGNAPLGTRAPAIGGGYWERVRNGWKWCTGSTFPRPGGDWDGRLIPPAAELDTAPRASEEGEADGAFDGTACRLAGRIGVGYHSNESCKIGAPFYAFTVSELCQFARAIRAIATPPTPAAECTHKWNTPTPCDACAAIIRAQAERLPTPAADVPRQSTHAVWRKHDWMPCYCDANYDHAIGEESSGVKVQAAEALARRFHELYEELAPQFGYATREDTRAFDPESANGRLMIAVCSRLAADVPRGGELPSINDLVKRIDAPDPVFDTWRNSVPDKHWATKDLSALRIGYELGRIAAGSAGGVDEASIEQRARELLASLPHIAPSESYADFALRAIAAALRGNGGGA
jgi:hypothetical protein